MGREDTLLGVSTPRSEPAFARASNPHHERQLRLSRLSLEPSQVRSLGQKELGPAG